MRVVGRIKSITRLQNSASGNPRLEFLIAGENGERKMRTSADSQIAYQFTGAVVSETAVFILNDASEVEHVTW